MSGLRGVVKDGWHPKGKDGGKESWRGDFKGINQVAGWMGKGKDGNANNQTEHVSRPLASLKDPASFGPPPKRNGTSTVASPGGATTTTTSTPNLRGVGAAVPAKPSSHQAEEDKPAPPPLPYRANRTGLETDHLPPPPVRNDANSVAQPVSSTSTRPGPSLPPRLPARAPGPQSASPPPPPYSETDNAVQMNQGAVSRLGQAGVSVPGLGIGGTGNDQSATAQTNLNKQVNELQSRFGSMSASSPGNSQPHVSGSPNGANPYVQPNSYSPTQERPGNNATSPGSAANTRRDQFEAGKKKLNAFNEKHRITERIQSYFEKPPAPGQETASAPPPPPPHPNHPSLSRQSSNIDVEALNKRKPPPPPPPAKKPGLQSKPVVSSSAGSTPSPPPLPLGTKPR